MFLADLRTQNEKEAFISLAYSVAKANGCLGYPELALINLYSDELGIDKRELPPRQAPLLSLCRTFSDRHAKEVAYINLLPLAFVDGYGSEGQQAIMEAIQNEFAISPAEAGKYEEEIKLLRGYYFPVCD
jgi:hypothetical protein